MPDLAKPRTCLLVIPAYEEHARLPPFLRELVAQLAQTSFVTHIQIVDDGSSAASLCALNAALKKIADPPSVKILPLIKQGHRRGKGSAIRTGWENGKDHAWLAFVDADGAISAAEVRRLLEHTQPQSPSTSCIAIRKTNSGRSLHRGWSSRLFTLFANQLFHTSFQDPQCGFKIVSSTAWQEVRSRSREDGFCFDLELLLLLQDAQLNLEEIAIDWQEKSGGHFRLFPDGLASLLAAIRVRIRRRMPTC